MADLYSTPWGLLGEDAIGEQAQDDFDRAPHGNHVAWRRHDDPAMGGYASATWVYAYAACDCPDCDGGPQVLALYISVDVHDRGRDIEMEDCCAAARRAGGICHHATTLAEARAQVDEMIERRRQEVRR